MPVRPAKRPKPPRQKRRSPSDIEKIEFNVTKIQKDTNRLLVEIAKKELASQVRLQNNVYRLKVDGRSARAFLRAKRRIEFNFAAPALTAAIAFVNDQLRRYTPTESGALRFAWDWYLNGSRINPNTIKKFGQRDELSVRFRPIYTRSAYWNARRKASKRWTYKIAKRAKRKFRGLSISEWWFESGPKGTKQPGLRIRLWQVYRRGDTNNG